MASGLMGSCPSTARRWAPGRLLRQRLTVATNVARPTLVNRSGRARARVAPWPRKSGWRIENDGTPRTRGLVSDGESRSTLAGMWQQVTDRWTRLQDGQRAALVIALGAVIVLLYVTRRTYLR